MSLNITRRRFLASSAASGLALATPGLFVLAISRAQARPMLTHGVQSGDVDANSGMIWARADRPSRAMFEIATEESFKHARRLAPLDALPETDFAVKRLLVDLPSDQEIFYRISFVDLDDLAATSEPVTGHFRTAPASRRSVKFVWSGDTAGQGWGIDEAKGGMKTYATMAAHEPDFFIHSGDTIYADGPLKETVEIKGGGVWKNLMVPEKAKVAETLDEFRGQWKYNMLDEHVRAFNAAVPTFFQWDDHEVVNNWSPSKNLSEDERYTVKSVPLLSARAARAFHEMTPIRYMPAEPGRVYRKIGYGPLLDVFILDLRSYRGPNTANDQNGGGPETEILGGGQVRWLKRALTNSRATWKVIACDMPIGLVVRDGDTRFEAVANSIGGDPLGREREIADLLRFIDRADIDNVVWLTADVHYAAAHHYSPDKAAFQDFRPFWEFVTGPLHAGTFGPNDLDMTFGPEVKFVKAPPEGESNLPPSEGLQFFGLVEIDGGSEEMTVRLMDSADNELFAQVLAPVRGG
ncbi:MAG: alkaline phosphatase D family protein [Hyphomicrobiales bacterium]|nr:alkaline phosphatase D family protein [Hyphomicrobiales bacterium]